jgi:hypothetical protein
MTHPAWDEITCWRCNGHGIVSSYGANDFLGPAVCDKCEGNGILFLHKKTNTLALYPGGPLCGRMERMPEPDGKIAGDPELILKQVLAERDELLDALEDVTNQACFIKDPVHGECLDSGALSAYADALNMLAKYGIVEIIEAHGRRVTAKKVQRRQP